MSPPGTTVLAGPATALGRLWRDIAARRGASGERAPRTDPTRELSRIVGRLPHFLEPGRRLSARHLPTHAVLRLEARLLGQADTPKTHSLTAACADLRCLCTTLSAFGRATRAETPDDLALRAALAVVLDAAAAFAQAWAPEDLAVVRAITDSDSAAMQGARRLLQAPRETADGAVSGLVLFDRSVWLVQRLVAELSLAARH